MHYVIRLADGSHAIVTGRDRGEALENYLRRHNRAELMPVPVLSDVLTEREAQDLKWGEQNHDPFKWLTILTEEIGEVAAEVLDQTPGLRRELVQVAAVAHAWIESLDRHSRVQSVCEHAAPNAR